jgi:SAM-dependent methyltransferase
VDAPDPLTVPEDDQPPSLPLPLEHLRGWYAIVMLALGRRTGLLDALLAGPGTGDELAERAGVDARNSREWLGALTAAGHAVHEDGVYSAAPDLAAACSPDFPIDLRAALDLSLVAPRVADEVAAAVQHGQGVGPGVFAEVSAIAGAINTPTYESVLVDDWMTSVPGLRDALDAGIRVAELAPGNGDAAVLVGRAFPRSTVVGWDVVATERDDLPPNVRLEVRDARALEHGEAFDLVYAIDAFHHFGAPEPVLAAVLRVLAPGGVLLLVEGGLTGDLDTDRHDPFAVIAYGAGLFYCLQENLAAGGDGRTGGDGTGWILEALSAAGFADVGSRSVETGNVVITGRAPGGA